MSHYRRGKDYSRPVGFVSAGVQGGTRQEGDDEEEGGSDSEDEVIIISYIRVHVFIHVTASLCIRLIKPKPNPKAASNKNALLQDTIIIRQHII